MLHELNVEEMDRPRTRWVKVGNIEIQVRYSAPIETDRFRRRLMQSGIARFNKDGRFEANVGREGDFYKAFAEHYVLDWRGNIKPEGTKYTAELMGQALSKIGPLLEALKTVIDEDDRFFENAGSASTES